MSRRTRGVSRPSKRIRRVKSIGRRWSYQEDRLAYLVFGGSIHGHVSRGFVSAQYPKRWEAQANKQNYRQMFRRRCDAKRALECAVAGTPLRLAAR